MDEAASSITYRIDEVARALEESLRGLEWAVAATPERLHHAAPLPRPDTGEQPWSVTMNLAHLTVYEELLAAPVLAEMAAGRDGSAAAPAGGEDWFERETRVLSERPATEILERLRTARGRQIEAVRSFSEERFNQPLTRLWGLPPRPAGWVAAKTFQHTWEHGNSILQAALFHRWMFADV